MNILIVDDVDVTREILVELLSPVFPNVKFYETSNIQDTLEITKRVKFDLIILDLQLEDDDYNIPVFQEINPHISGLRLLRELKEKVVVYTSMTNKYYFVECTKLGARSVHKGDIKSLIEIIKEVD